MKNLLFILSVISILSACNNGPTQKSMAGKYEISFNLKNKEEIKSKIKDEMGKASKDVKIDFEKSKDELEKDMDFSNIDTTTSEGKIEYAAKKFANEMAKSGLGMGEAAGDMTDALGSVAGSFLEGFDSILENQKFDVELQEDGDVKLSGLAKMFAPTITWSVEGDYLIIKQEDKTEAKKGLITKSDKDGFECEIDQKITLIAKRKM